MASNDHNLKCRLCNAPLHESESGRLLCGVCDEYAQHVALQANRHLDRVVGELQNALMFVAASKNVH